MVIPKNIQVDIE